jgi:hypothetical protein
MIIIGPPPKPGDPPPPPFDVQIRYAIAFAAALFAVVGVATLISRVIGALH